MKLSALSGIALAGLIAVPASAKMTTISLDGFCNVMQIRTQGQTYAVDFEKDHCEKFLGEGRILKLKDAGRIADIGGLADQDASRVLNYEIQFPFVSGGSWNLYETTDGQTMTPVTSGTYTVTGGAARVSRAGKRPVTSLLRR